MFRLQVDLLLLLLLLFLLVFLERERETLIKFVRSIPSTFSANFDPRNKPRLLGQLVRGQTFPVRLDSFFTSISSLRANSYRFSKFLSFSFPLNSFQFSKKRFSFHLLRRGMKFEIFLQTREREKENCSPYRRNQQLPRSQLRRSGRAKCPMAFPFRATRNKNCAGSRLSVTARFLPFFPVPANTVR